MQHVNIIITPPTYIYIFCIITCKGIGVGSGGQRGHLPPQLSEWGGKGIFLPPQNLKQKVMNISEEIIVIITKDKPCLLLTEVSVRLSSGGFRGGADPAYPPPKIDRGVFF